MTVLQTRDGHLDIMGDLLSEGNELPTRFTDKIGRQYLQNMQLSEVVFGSELIHLQFRHSSSNNK